MMPTFKYLGLPEGQKKAMVETHMAPLMDDEAPHPRFGGFPIPAENEIGYYEGDNDKPKARKAKEKKRDSYRKERLAELKAKAEAADAMMVFTVGRVPGKMDRGTRIEFPKGKPVDVSDRHKKLVAKLRALSGQEVVKMAKNGSVIFKGVVVDEPLFEEVIEKPAEKPAEEPQKRGPGRPPKAKEE